MNKKVLAAVLLVVILAAVSVTFFLFNGRQGAENGKENYTVRPGDKNEGENIEDPEGNTEPSGEPSPEGEQDPLPPKPREDVKVRAVYVTGSTAGSSSSLNRIIDLINKTELNAVVLDIREDGVVNYPSEVPMVKELGLSKKLYDVDEVIRKFHDNGIYVIGRIVCFKDNNLAKKRPDLAVKKADKTTLWKDNSGFLWLNPYNEEVWKFNIDIAREAVEKGFDEIQFDYVRFPTPGLKVQLYYGENVPERKSEAINGFLAMAQEEIYEGMGVKVSADIYAIVCESIFDGELIGQELELVGKDIDYISPMIYPSHYSNKAQNGKGQIINGVLFEAPDLKPYEVVYHTLIKAKNRLSSVEGYRAKMRPYLQAFTANWLRDGYWQTYGKEQVRQQIRAVYDAGYEEWILWDPNNRYPESWFLKEGEVEAAEYEGPENKEDEAAVNEGE